MDLKTIKNIASLARIKLTAKEEEEFKDELSVILDYVEQLNGVDTEGVDPLYQATGIVNSLRADESRGEFEMDESLNEKLIGQAPRKEGRYIKVKSVLSK